MGWRADQVIAYAADQSGTTNDPKLVIEHSDPPPLASTGLQVEEETNPTNVATSNPRFSAIHQTASTTALAISYQIQIATSSSYWGVPYWDSGKKTLSSSTPQSQRTPQIFSTTTFALNGSTYYWRIKLWNNIDAEGAWSTTTSSFRIGSSTEVTAAVTVDGFIQPAPYPGAWSVQHSATTAHALHDSDDWLQLWTWADNPGAGYQIINRTFFTFDTTKVPTSSAIISAKVRLYVTNVYPNYPDSYAYVNLYQGLQAATSSLSGADVDECGDAETDPTAGATAIYTSDVASSTYVDLNMNGTGIGWLTKGGYSTLCIREGHDAENQAPTQNGQFTGIKVASKEDSTSAYSPVLVVTYSQ
jgi:hypothetical protein